MVEQDIPELRQINRKLAINIRKKASLSASTANQRYLVSKRLHEAGLNIMPPLLEMKRRYYSLYVMNERLRSYNDELEYVELRIIQLGRRKKEILGEV